MRRATWIGALLWSTTGLAADLPWQGRVLDATGAPISGQREVEIRLYAGGAVVHTEDLGTVDIADGYLAALIDGVPEATLATVDEVELVIADVALAPRLPVGTVPRAANRGVGLVDLGGGVRGWSDGTAGRSCEDYRRPPGGYAYTGLTGDGTYRVDPDGPGAIAAYDVLCLMTEHGGGWTRILNIAPGISTGSMTSVPKSRERVNLGDWNYSNDLLRDSGQEVLIRENEAPYRTHRYRFDAFCTVSDELFIGMLTGDHSSTCTGVWNWVDQVWASHAVSTTTTYNGGRCNTNNHTQWNCVPANGVRFHWGTRDYNGDGGQNAPGAGDAWAWFTGYNTGYGDYSKLVLNWDGQYNSTPHSVYVR